MAENKKSFILYADLINTISQLPNEKAGELFKHILEYVNDMDPITEDLLLNIAFEPIKLQLKRDLDKWRSNIEQRRQAGLKSAEARRAKKNEDERALTTVERDSTNPTDTDTDTVTGNVKKNIKERKADFKKSLHPHLEKYGKDMLNEFYAHWTEHGEKDRKMRFEKQTSFSIPKRLSTWKKNEIKFSLNEKNKSNNRGGFESDTTKRTIEQINNGFE